MQIDLIQLRTFVAVAEEQHLTRAAERLHISQSTASAHVRAVEERLGTQLFVRTNRNLELTRAGQFMLGKAKTLLNEASNFISSAREVRGKIEGNLVVCTGGEPSSSRVGEIVGALRPRHPHISVDLRALPSSSTLQGLRTGELDVGLILGAASDPGLSYYELTRLPFVVAGPVKWKRQIEAADWTALAALPWLTTIDSGMASSVILHALFAERQLELNTVARFDNTPLGRAMMEAGVGLMLMREEHANRGLAQGTLAVSPIAHAQLPVVLAHVSGRRQDPLIGAFLEAASDVWPGLRSAGSNPAF